MKLKGNARYIGRPSRAKKFADERIVEAFGLTNGINGVPAQFSHIGHTLPPAIKTESVIDASTQQKLGIKVIDGTIIWTRDQSRLIEYLAQYIIEEGRYKHFRERGESGAQVHIMTMFRFGKKLGIPQREFRALRNFKEFWMAVNERKKEVLGHERFHEIADAIYRSALDGDYRDRKLYLEVFCDYIPTKKIKKESKSYESKLIEVRNSHRKAIAKEKSLEMEESDGTFKLKRPEEAQEDYV